ncbi:hypothetical protein BLA60_02120 [Actinophytocola xinjiangensis]|uniref:Carrier domain-containing protein n=1 Tax=Actinophytocola xinjiangensis TaxID=485602 RepID=A0A7Z0WRH2_9PSEU|nr:non-ribosomal peptide synthetase [Actinophytocola xinjiangensis]OLF13996.1 hypothetical protein BLA60_02120 [Actinophytocola xinjiangensis]
MPVLPLSFAQRRLWFLDRLAGPSATYNLPLALRLTGALDVPALRAALGDVLTRHEALRTVFPDRDGEPHQQVLPPDPRLTVRPLPSADVPAAAAEPFDVTAEPPLRATLFTGDAEALLLVVVHHIAADGVSLGLLVRDLATAYRARAGHGGPPAWAELPVQYADYTLWQRELVDSVRDDQLAHWRSTLRGLPEIITVPPDRPRPAMASHRGALVPVDLGARRHRDLAALARRHDCTVFMVLHAALVVLLTRHGAGTDVPVGTVVAGRTEADLEDLVGLFVNTLVLRTDTGGDPTFGELLGRVRRVNLAALAHQDLPFDVLVEALNPPRRLASHPLFQVMLALERHDPSPPDLGPVTAVRRDLDVPAAKVDLTFQLREHRDGVDGFLEYATDLYDEPTARAVVDRFVRVLDAVVADPDRRVGRIGLISAAERRRVLVDWNTTGRDVRPGLLHEAGGHQGIAVVAGDRRLTRADLDRRADALAHRLVEAGVRPGAVVGVALPRSPEFVIAVHAVLRAGGAYLPLPPDHPPQRLAYLVSDARPRCVVGDPAPFHDEVTVVGVDETAVAPGDLPRLTPHHPAYVLYTSGSTGRPKGVVVSHGAVDNRLRWAQAELPLGPADRVLHKTPAGFDVSVWELFWPWRAGATLVLAEPGAEWDPALIAGEIARHGVTAAHFVPSMLRALLAEPPVAAPALRRVLSSGEALAADTAGAFHRRYPGVELVNLYGPTEAAIDVTAHRCVPGDPLPVPIGRPVWNTQVRVLDDGLAPCPVGVPGELYLAGAQLAEGYLGRPALTAGRFVADPYGPGRLYRTGDVVRWRRDGELEFLGRADDQVKLRGHRLELGEIESLLLADDSVADARATVHDGQFLAAYVTPAPGHRPDPVALRGVLTARLPAAVVPPVTVLPSLPLGPNGKLDRSGLPPPAAAPAGRPPGTPRERAVAALFEQVLGVTGVGLDDDFFALGGHSLLLVPLARRLRTRFGVDVAVHELFLAPTVAALDRRLAGAGHDPDGHAPLLTLRPGGERPPLVFVHPATGLSWCYSRVLDHIDPDRPVYGLQARTAHPPGSVAEMAQDYLAIVREIQPSGPYHLLGWSFGGNVAHTMAARLRAAGEQVALLVLFDSHPTLVRRSPPERELLATALENLLGRPPDRVATDAGMLDALRRAYPPLADATDDQVLAVVRAGAHHVRLQAGATPETFDGDLTVVVAERDGPGERWDPFVTGQTTVVGVDAGHHDLFSTAAPATGAALSAILRTPGKVR